MFFCHLSSFLKQQFLFLFHFQLCLDFFKTWLANRLEVPISYNFLSKICFQIPACFGFLTSFLQLRSFGYLAVMSTWQTMHIFAALGDEKKDIFFSLLLALKYPLLLIVFINLTVRHFFQPLFRVSLIALLFHLDVSSRTLFPRLGSHFSGKHKWNFVDFKEMSPSKILQGRCVKLDASFDGKNRFL